LSKSFSTHFRAELTKIKDPPMSVNPIFRAAYRGSEVGFRRHDVFFSGREFAA